MKLFLSSYRLGNNPEKFVNLFGENKKVAHIANAIDNDKSEERREKVAEGLDSLEKLGLQPEEIDLRNYFGKEEELRKVLRKFAGVWIRGGNTFVLRKAFAYSGFDNFLIEKRSDKDFIYGGYSAGICILAPDLHGYDIVDPPEVLPEKYKPETIWDGMGFLDYYIEPHYKSNHPESYLIDKEVAYLEKNNLPYKGLRDGEVIITEV